eukprot:m51a1_g6230 putative 3 5 -cyclic nucleotide phosphodiesterase (676) ;mRNA; r:261436-264271
MESTVLRSTFEVETIYTDIVTNVWLAGRVAQEALDVTPLSKGKVHLRDFTYLDGPYPLVADIGPNRTTDAWLSCDALDAEYIPDPLLVEPFKQKNSNPRCCCETACDFLWGMEASQVLDPLVRSLVLKFPFVTAWVWTRVPFWMVMVNERGQVIGAADETLTELWGSGACNNYIQSYLATHQELSMGWTLWFFARSSDVDLSGAGGDHTMAVVVGVIVPVSAVLVATIVAVAIIFSRRGHRAKPVEQQKMAGALGSPDAITLPVEYAIRTLFEVQRRGALPHDLQQGVAELIRLIAANEIYKAGHGVREKVRGLGDYLLALLTVDERPEVALSSAACTVDENYVPGSVNSPDHTGPHELASCVDSAGPAAFESWDYDVCDIEVPAGATLLEVVGMCAVERQGLVAALGLDSHRIRAFLRAVDRSHSPALQFHNSTHAADAVQAMHALLSGSRMPFTPLERLAALVACAAHDMGHPGVSNAYLRATADPLAASCGAGVGAIENASGAEAARLLQSADAGVTQGSKMGAAEALELREAVVELVRCTDLARHLEVTSMLGARTATGKLDPQSSADRLLALRALVKAADASRAARKWVVCERWARRAMEELREQGERERRAGLSASPFTGGGVADTAKCQTAFTQFVARPLVELLQPLCPEVARVMLSNLVGNAANWEQ